MEPNTDRKREALKKAVTAERNAEEEIVLRWMNSRPDYTPTEEAARIIDSILSIYNLSWSIENLNLAYEIYKSDYLNLPFRRSKNGVVFLTANDLVMLREMKIGL